MEFDQEALPLEAQLPYFGPREDIDLGEVLEDNDAHMGYCQIERDAFMIL